MIPPFILSDIFDIYMSCVKDSSHLLEGQDEIHLASHGFSHRFQFFRRTRSDKDDLRFLMLFLDESCSQCHRCQRHGNTVCVVRKQFFAIIDQAGQQEVAINGSCSGTSFMKSSASCTAQRSAPMATSKTSAKPRTFIAARSFPGVTFGPNWPTKPVPQRRTLARRSGSRG